MLLLNSLIGESKYEIIQIELLEKIEKDRKWQEKKQYQSIMK